MSKLEVLTDFIDYSYQVKGLAGDVLTVEGPLAQYLIDSGICKACDSVDAVNDEVVKPARRTRKSAN